MTTVTHERRAALDINLPNYASAIVSADEIVSSISALCGDVRAVAQSDSRGHSPMKINKLLITAVLAIAIGAPIAGFVAGSNGDQPMMPGLRVPFLHGLSVAQPAASSELASLDRADVWLNSPPLTPAELRGKVVLVQFWTFTCINWLRTLPYVRAWADKYRDQGLVVIGVHTPEFSFEKNVDNVRGAAKSLRVDYPVAVDNERGIWRAFNNQHWPAYYFIDAQGRIRHRLWGEGSYEQSEMVIQELLAEAGAKNIEREPTMVEGRGIEAAADWRTLKSGENYVGYRQTEQFMSPGGVVRDIPHVYALPAKLSRNQWALSGDWTVKGEPALLNKPNGRIVYGFRARDVHLVMGPAVSGSAVRFRVTIDGEPPGAAHGLDVDEKGNGTVNEPRLYQLIRQQTPIADRQFEIEFLDPGVEAFAFTFG